MKSSLVLVSLLLFASCASQPERITFAEIAQANESRKQDYPKRIQKDIQADCLNSNCTLPEQNLQILVTLITNLQDEVERRIDAYNALIDALSHCQYMNVKKDEAIQLLEQRGERLELISTVKQVVTGGLCAVLLGVQ